MYWLGKVEEQAESRQVAPMVVAELRMAFNTISLPFRMDIPHIIEFTAIRSSAT
jgi:hypothetical protein